MIHYTEVFDIMYNIDPVQINYFKIKIVSTCVTGEHTQLQDRKKDDDIEVKHACMSLNESSDRQGGLEHVVMNEMAQENFL